MKKYLNIIFTPLNSHKIINHVLRMNTSNIDKTLMKKNLRNMCSFIMNFIFFYYNNTENSKTVACIKALLISLLSDELIIIEIPVITLNMNIKNLKVTPPPYHTNTLFACLSQLFYMKFQNKHIVNINICYLLKFYLNTCIRSQLNRP